MIGILIAGAVAAVLSFSLTPLYIRFLVKKQYGQFVRDDGPTTHATKRGTPTMGGVMIILATLIGYGM
ncbi:MAG: phospho-N-acetylmuramoyl-pentapeptide-transferase, partial [Dermabacter sp.]|nr:phospho-N-acetylmuramoyl-pentapeptide-transferase [Dermabacter sp.]